jgi:hypothetical protein
MALLGEEHLSPGKGVNRVLSATDVGVCVVAEARITVSQVPALGDAEIAGVLQQRSSRCVAVA